MPSVFRPTGRWIPGLDLLEGRSLLSTFADPFPAPRPPIHEMSPGSFSQRAAGSSSDGPYGPAQFPSPGGDYGGDFFVDHPHGSSYSPWDRPFAPPGGRSIGPPGLDGATPSAQSAAGMHFDSASPSTVDSSASPVEEILIVLRAPLPGLTRFEQVAPSPPPAPRFTPFARSAEPHAATPSEPGAIASTSAAQLSIVSATTASTAPVAAHAADKLQGEIAPPVGIVNARMPVNVLSPIGSPGGEFAKVAPGFTLDTIPNLPQPDRSSADSTPIDRSASTARDRGQSIVIPAPVGADLLTEANPLDLGSLEQSLFRLLDRFDDIGRETTEEPGGVDYVLPLLVPVVAFEVARRWRARQAPRGVIRAWRSRSSVLHGFF